MVFSKALIRFLIVGSILFVSWFIAYEWWIKPNATADRFITEYVSIGICNVLNFFGYESKYTFTPNGIDTYIFIAPKLWPVVRVGASCNGFELLMLFTIFIISYPGNIWLKAGYLVVGNLIIHTVNILRNFALTLFSYYDSPHYDLFHRYIFIFLIYGLVFLLWMFWANKLSLMYRKHGS